MWHPVHKIYWSVINYIKFIQLFQSFKMANNFSIEQSVKFDEFISNSYWQPGQPVDTPVRTFRQNQYVPLPNAVPDLDQALSGAMLDCGLDLH